MSAYSISSWIYNYDHIVFLSYVMWPEGAKDASWELIYTLQKSKMHSYIEKHVGLSGILLWREPMMAKNRKKKKKMWPFGLLNKHGGATLLF